MKNEVRRYQIPYFVFQWLLWGDDNIIVEDAYVEFYKIDGEVTSGFNVLLVWKNDGGTWRIFRDVPEPRKKKTSVSDLNNLGYELMDNEELEKALEVFKLNTILLIVMVKG